MNYYYLAGYLFGAGSKKRAAQTDIWRELRGQPANLGICDAQWMQKRYRTTPSTPASRPSPTSPKTSSPTLPSSASSTPRSSTSRTLVGLLAAAKEHFSAVIAANPDDRQRSRPLQKIHPNDRHRPKQAALNCELLPSNQYAQGSCVLGGAAGRGDSVEI